MSGWRELRVSGPGADDESLANKGLEMVRHGSWCGDADKVSPSLESLSLSPSQGQENQGARSLVLVVVLLKFEFLPVFVNHFSPLARNPSTVSIP